MAEDSSAMDVGARYAQALFDLAVETGALSAVESDVKALRAMHAESRDFRTLLIAPALTDDDRSRALAALAERAGLASITRSFLGLLARNRRTAALPASLVTFDRLLAARRGAVAAKVTTAAPLSKSQADVLAKSLREALGKDPQIETAVDPSLLGGIRVQVGSRLYDASLKSKLDSLKFALKRA